MPRQLTSKRRWYEKQVARPLQQDEEGLIDLSVDESTARVGEKMHDEIQNEKSKEATGKIVTDDAMRQHALQYCNILCFDLKYRRIRTLSVITKSLQGNELRSDEEYMLRSHMYSHRVSKAMNLRKSWLHTSTWSSCRTYLAIYSIPTRTLQTAANSLIACALMQRSLPLMQEAMGPFTHPVIQPTACPVVPEKIMKRPLLSATCDPCRVAAGPALDTTKAKPSPDYCCISNLPGPSPESKSYLCPIYQRNTRKAWFVSSDKKECKDSFLRNVRSNEEFDTTSADWYSNLIM